MLLSTSQEHLGGSVVDGADLAILGPGTGGGHAKVTQGKGNVAVVVRVQQDVGGLYVPMGQSHSVHAGDAAGQGQRQRLHDHDWHGLLHHVVHELKQRTAGQGHGHDQHVLVQVQARWCSEVCGLHGTAACCSACASSSARSTHAS